MHTIHWLSFIMTIIYTYAKKDSIYRFVLLFCCSGKLLRKFPFSIQLIIKYRVALSTTSIKTEAGLFGYQQNMDSTVLTETNSIPTDIRTMILPR